MNMNTLITLLTAAAMAPMVSYKKKKALSKLSGQSINKLNDNAIMQSFNASNQVSNYRLDCPPVLCPRAKCPEIKALMESLGWVSI